MWVQEKGRWEVEGRGQSLGPPRLHSWEPTELEAPLLSALGKGGSPVGPLSLTHLFSVLWVC